MASVRVEERRPGGHSIRGGVADEALESAMQRIHKLETDLDFEKKRSSRVSSAVQKVYERGGVVRKTDRDGRKKVTVFTGDSKNDKIHVDSLRGRFVAHVTRHI